MFSKDKKSDASPCLGLGIRPARLIRVPLGLCCAAILLASPAHAQTAAAPSISAGTIERDITRDLPWFTPYSGEAVTGNQPAPAVQKNNKFIQDLNRDLPPEKFAATPVDRITLTSEVLYQPIYDLLQARARNHHPISTQDLEEARQQIWSLGIQNKLLLHVQFRLIPDAQNAGKSRLMVDVNEIAVRHVAVEAVGNVRKSVVEDIQNEASREFYNDKTINLDDLADSIQNRLRLGDVLLHLSIEPVDETHVDLKILVKAAPAQQPSALLQYDNSGGWSFGRDRVLGAVSLPGLGLPADRLDLLGMKTADVGNGDYSDGTYYGRAEYQFPVSAWGVRLDSWASGLHYHTVKSTPSNSFANGEAIEVGQGVIRPFYTDDVTIVDLHADYFFKYTVDRVLENERIDEKNEHNLRLKSTLAHSFGETQMVQATLGLTEGKIDLTGDAASYDQDQAGPKVNGYFTKLEQSAVWSGKLDAAQKTDFRLGLQGQWGSNNLDPMEQFALGGSNGLRAFGSGEASADSGYILNGDLGYAAGYGLRPYVLYDMGEVWKTSDPWQGEPNPNNYVLQDVGFGVSGVYGPVELNLSFAHQVGPNPGVTSQGLDIDNTQQHYRVWSSLSYRY